MTVRVSIVLPTHNGIRYLDQAVEAVIEQSFAHWELILVDDASTDATADRVDKWAGRDRRIQTLHLVSNRRLPGALNAGFALARGEYLTWTSDDNWHHHEALARLVEVLDHRREIDIVYADWVRVYDSAQASETVSVPHCEALVAGNCVGPCFLYRRAVDEVLAGYDESLFLAEDYDFWLRAYPRFRLLAVHEPLYYYRVHADSLTARRTSEVSAVADEAIRRWIDSPYTRDRRLRSLALVAMGERALGRGDVGRARRCFRRAMWISQRPWLYANCRTRALDAVFGVRFADWVRSAWMTPNLAACPND